MVPLKISLRAKIELAIAVVLLVGGVLAFRTWLSEHDLRLQAEAQSKAQQAVQTEAKAERAALEKELAARDSLYQAQLQTLDRKFANAASPEALAQLVGQIMGLSKPIQLVTPPASAENPNPAPAAQVPAIDFPQAKLYVSNCEACKLNLEKTAKDLTDREAQMQLAQKEIDSLKTERDTWKTAAKGGTFWQRAGRAAKWFAIGAGAGAVAVCGTGHCR